MKTHGMLSRLLCSPTTLWCGAATGVLLLAAPALAVDRLVPSQYPNIQAAMTAAVNGDRIVLADGTYTGATNRNIDFGAKNVLVMSASGNPAACIIDCENAARGFILASGQTNAAGLSGLTIRNGNAGPGSSYGGCIFMDGGADPTIYNCIIQGGRADKGGGASADHAGCNPIVANCIFTANSCIAYGGGMIADHNAVPSIVNCVFVGNASTGGFGPGGGLAIFGGNGVVRNCTFTANSATHGSALNLEGSGNTVVTNCIMWGNINSPLNQTQGSVTFCDLQGLPAAPDANGNFGADPLFVNAAGGNFRLQAGSPCINAGSNVGITAPPFPGVNGIPLDFDGLGRICGPAVDLGAFEAGGCIPIANDFCAGATLISNGTLTGSTVGANRDGADNCRPSATSGDVWYRWIAPCSGTLRLDTCGSAFDTVLSLYTGDCGSLAQTACNDDGVGSPCPAESLASYITAPVTSGTSYLIRVSGFNALEGAFTLTVDTGSSCERPTTVANGSTNFDTTCGTPDALASCAFTNNSRALWYSYTATCNTTAVFSTCGSTFDTVLTAYTGACGSLTEIACNDDTSARCSAGTLSSYITFPVTAGNTYRIRVAGYNGQSGTGVLLAACSAPCPCDWNGDLTVTSQDFFDFLTGFFAGDADYDNSGSTTSQDFFDFISCFFTGC